METIKKVEEVALINKHETWSFLKLWYCDYSVSSSSRSAPDVPVFQESAAPGNGRGLMIQTSVNAISGAAVTPQFSG